MDEKQSILVSIGAAIACNCIPCYEHYYMKAKQSGISNADLYEAVSIGEKVKNGAAVVIGKTVDSIKNGDIAEEELGKDAPCGCGCN
jgi:hypothetical protein